MEPMPSTMVQKMTGAMSILITPTNAVPSHFRFAANSGNAKPTAMPSTTAAMTARYSQCVRSRRRFGVPAETGAVAMTVSWRSGMAMPNGVAPGDPGHRFVHFVRGAHHAVSGHTRWRARARAPRTAPRGRPQPGRAAARTAGPPAGGGGRRRDGDRLPRRPAGGAARRRGADHGDRADHRRFPAGGPGGHRTRSDRRPA